MTTPTPLWQRLTANGTPRHAVSEQIQTVWDWLDETFGKDVPSAVYNALVLQAIEAASWGDEGESEPGPESSQ